MEEALQEALAADSVFQQLLTDCLAAEADYLRICEVLPPDCIKILERYLSLCEEMDHRKLSLLLKIAAQE